MPSHAPVSRYPSRPARPYSQRAELRTVDFPSDSALWCRMVVGFTIVTVVGAVLVVIGASFINETRHSDKSASSFAHTWCIISIGNWLFIFIISYLFSETLFYSCLVSGILLMGTGIVLGKLLISSKWKKQRVTSPEQSSSTPHSSQGFLSDKITIKYVSNACSSFWS